MDAPGSSLTFTDSDWPVSAGVSAGLLPNRASLRIPSIVFGMDNLRGTPPKRELLHDYEEDDMRCKFVDLF